MKRRDLIRLLLAAMPLAAASAASAAPSLWRVSLENACSHVQAQAVMAFGGELERRAGGRLKVDVLCGAGLYRDWDVVPMLELGRVEMAVPGAWQLSRLVPSFDVFMLPLFMGRSPEDHHRLVDGELGAALAGMLEKKADVAVIGSWLDLGRAHLFGVGRTLRSFADLAGLRVRIPGGEVNELSLRALGAKPTTIPWPDLPGRMQAGDVDAVLTTHETIASAKLWKHGVTSVFESAQYFSMFVPVASRAFWESLPEDLRGLARSAWEETAGPQRRAAAERQDAAKDAFVRQGGVVVQPTAEERLWAHGLLAGQEERFAGQAGVRGDILALARRSLSEPAQEAAR